MRRFLGCCNQEIQRQVSRSTPGANLRQQLLSLLQRNVFAPAQSTELQMLTNCMHLRAGHRAVQIWREQRLCLGTRHGITSIVLPRIETRESALDGSSSSGGCKPICGPISRTYSVNRWRSASLPRVSRDFTVPSDTSVISAISS